MVEEQRIQSSEKRAALSAESHIGHTEVPKSSDACVSGNDSNLSHIQMSSHLIPFKQLRQRQMPNRLPLSRDQINVFADIEASLLRKPVDCVRYDFAQLDVD